MQYTFFSRIPVSCSRVSHLSGPIIGTVRLIFLLLLFFPSALKHSKSLEFGITWIHEWRPFFGNIAWWSLVGASGCEVIPEHGNDNGWKRVKNIYVITQWRRQQG